MSKKHMNMSLILIKRDCGNLESPNLATNYS